MLLRVLLLAGLVVPAMAEGPAVRLQGFIQSVTTLSEDNKAPVFGLDRVRLVARGPLGERMDFFLQTDFARLIVPAGSSQADRDGASPALIKDARLGLLLPGGHTLYVGKFKTPIGREFALPGPSLDFVKRGFGHMTMIFERDLGMMWQSPAWGGARLQARLGAFNAGPNGANDTGDPGEGLDLSWAGSLGATPLPGLKLLGYGGLATTSVETVGVAQEELSLAGGAIEIARGPLAMAMEGMTRDDPDHPDRDGSTWYAQLRWTVRPWLEPAFKLERLDVSDNTKDRRDWTAGVNIYLNPQRRQEAKLALNYVGSDLDGFSGLQLMIQGAF
jgi:hypothetical protein